MLFGATIGDIAGSRFECHDYKRKDFEFFHYSDKFTDDTVMTMAIYEACKEIKDKNLTDKDDIEKCFTTYMQKWGREYPSVGYGGRFSEWIFSNGPQPYNSWGNGSAMRVSSIGWMFDSLEEVERMAELSANPTHNHIEGIRGAKAIAGAVFIARTTKSKKAVKRYIEGTMKYKLHRCCFVRPKYKFDVSCQGTIPVAVEAFLESKSFEDAIRIAISMGGDSDTIGAITGSIAEAFYGVPDELKEGCKQYLDEHILSILT